MAKYTITFRELAGEPMGDAVRRVEATTLTLGDLPHGAIQAMTLNRLTSSVLSMPAEDPGTSYLIHPVGNSFTAIKCPTAALEMALFSGGQDVALPLEAKDFMAIGKAAVGPDAGQTLAEQAEIGRFKIENQHIVSAYSYSGQLQTAPILPFGKPARHSVAEYPLG